DQDMLPPGLTEAPSPLTLLQALRRGWLKALPLGVLLAAIAGTLVYFLRPAKYTAFVLLRIAPTEQKVLPNQSMAYLDRTNQYQKTQVALIKSHVVIRKALEPDNPVQIRQLPLIREQGDATAALS